FAEALVRPGLDPLNWTERNNVPVWGVVQTSRTEWSMFVSEHYRRDEVAPRLRRLVIRPHGFASLNANAWGGSFVTKPLRVGGAELHINASTSAAGSIHVQVEDHRGRPIPGLTREEVNGYYGDELDARITWQGGRNLGPYIGQPIRLRFWLADADLYALWTTSELRS
ncbi:MAG: hypothetical protein O3A51_10850, partial [Verrucomicrobia bacterium]|nr:hypothetical protein [Verrucomicrobiota bacterium]